MSSTSDTLGVPDVSGTVRYKLRNYPRKRNITTLIIVGIVVLIIIIIIVLSVVFGEKGSHKFSSMLRQSEHAGTPNKPVIIDSELNWNQKYNFSNDDRTADEYYDDRIYNHAGHISAPKHKTDFKLPGTVTLYRKYTEKSAN